MNLTGSDAVCIETVDGEMRVRYPLHPKQRQAFYSEATELLFGGATEGGKSHFIRVALIMWCLDIPGLQCLIIRKNSADVYQNHVEGPTGFRVLLDPYVKAKECRVTQDGVKFENGSQILLEHCQDERKLTSAQGVEKHVLVFDEATQIPERLITFVRMWCRMSLGMKKRLPEWARGKFPRIIYTANPIGISVGFFRRHFVKARAEGAIEEVFGFRRQYIRSLPRHNLAIDAKATEGRVAARGDASLTRALIDGDWDAPTGDFFPEWDEARHVIPDITPPAYWFRFRTFDWGTAEPFACHWYAVSDGEMFKANVRVFEDGIYVTREKQFWFPRGCLIAYREWYGCNPEKPAEGLRMRNEDIATGILSRSYEPYEKQLITLTDSFVFPDRGEEGGKTIAKTFADNGVPLTLGRTARKSGWSQMRARLIGKQFDSNSELRTPLIVFCECCTAARDYIPALPRHPSEGRGLDDAAEHGEATHVCDIVRLACMAEVIVNDPDPPPHDTAKVSNVPTFSDALKMVRRHKAQERYGA